MSSILHWHDERTDTMKDITDTDWAEVLRVFAIDLDADYEKGDAMSDDPRIVHVASELSVPLGPEAENDGNREYVIDVIAAVDYANEMCDRDFAAGVNAARDAVAAHIRADLTGQEMFCGRKRGILAAIDALKEKP